MQINGFTSSSWPVPLDCPELLIPDCNAPYCYIHWHAPESSYGHSPCGHGKSLDPHW